MGNVVTGQVVWPVIVVWPIMSADSDGQGGDGLCGVAHHVG